MTMHRRENTWVRATNSLLLINSASCNSRIWQINTMTVDYTVKNSNMMDMTVTERIGVSAEYNTAAFCSPNLRVSA